MRKLRLQFALFFLALALPFSFLVRHSFLQLDAEGVRLWQSDAEKTFNLMQARVSDFLSAEDARDFSDYDPGRAGDSPLSAPPENDPRGLIGYFQIDSDGTFRSPHRASESGAMEAMLKKLTESFRTGMKEARTGGDIVKKADAANDFVDLDAFSAITGVNAAPESEAVSKLSDYDVSPLTRNAKAPQKQQVYPNPLLKQKTAAPRQKSALADEKMEKARKLKNEEILPAPSPAEPIPKQDLSDDVADGTESLALLQSGSIGGSGASGVFSRSLSGLSDPAFEGEISPKPAPEPEANKKDAVDNGPIFLDPFRARLVERQFLIFYRKAWREQKMAVQGFAVKLDGFYDWLMQQSFDNSDLPGFAEARLDLDGETFARHGLALASAGFPLFERQLGYPLNQFTWRVRAQGLPEDPARRLLAAFGALLALALTVGLALIYRTAASEVRLSQKRQDFVSAVTHELKTPLTSIRMSAEMLREGWVKEESKRQEYYGVIASEGERLGKLIDNVLQLARLEKKTARFDLVTEPPNARFDEIVKELSAFVTANGCAWTHHAEPGLPAIRFDPDAVKQILFTLVENAVKFSQFSAEKSVSLTLKREGDRIAWSVSDKGPGVPKSELKKIFEKFYRVESELTRKTKGTGIGLAMARMMAEGMGAGIEAVNHEKCGGLTLVLSFPLRKNEQPFMRTNRK